MIKMLFLLIMISFMYTRCSPSVDFDIEKKAIAQLLQQERKAHFDKDLNLFFSTFADSTISVYHGHVEWNTRAENKARFEPYFNKVKFIKWDDVSDPIIDISKDGSMAFAVLNKTVVVQYPDSSGTNLEDSTLYAWVSIYKKQSGQWKLVCNASTQ